MANKKKHPGGRPSKYTPAMCASIVKFFDIEPVIHKDVTVTLPGGGTMEKTISEAVDMPFLTDWCHSVGITRETMNQWVVKYPEFAAAHQRAKELQEKILVTNGLQDRYNCSFAIFTAKNILGWRDKQDHELTGKDGKDLPAVVFLPVQSAGESGKVVG